VQPSAPRGFSRRQRRGLADPDTIGGLAAPVLDFEGRLAGALTMLGYRGPFPWQAADEQHAPSDGVPPDGA
jgi:hypothetical protein